MAGFIMRSFLLGCSLRIPRDAMGVAREGKGGRGRSASVL